MLLFYLQRAPSTSEFLIPDAFAILTLVRVNVIFVVTPDVPPTSTKRESNALDQATVVSTPEFAPVSRAVNPCPTPSCRTLARMVATMLIAQIVRLSSAVKFGCTYEVT